MDHDANFCFCHELGRFFRLVHIVSKGIGMPCIKWGWGVGLERRFVFSTLDV